ncbi:MAG: substrate-binding domain-containing protein [Nocardioides sp.]|uniref:substrate-binding domain-containing protein n=1 Tax=Nocardioides sp. TaxID=35761 RepID=UPI0039E21B83
MKQTLRRRLLATIATAMAAVTVALSGPTAASAAASYALIQGSGSSWAANAVNQWVADVASNGQQVVYTANGAAQGRKDYANKSTDFGVTDSPYRGEDPTTHQQDSPLGRSFAYLPIAAGGTSFPYHVEVAGKLVRNIRLSGETIAKIFTNQITNWNDAAITKDNNGNALPSITIIPVVRADGAGVTNQFSTWMTNQYPSIWAACNGKAAPTDYFPANCGKANGPQKAQSGSDGVMNFVKGKNANGAIAMEEYSYPLMANYPVVKMLNKAGYYTLPTQYNVAVALTAAEINNDASDADYLTQKLDNVYVNADKRTYPLSSYVYAIIPTAASDSKLSTTAKRQNLADFLYYSICQGQSEIGPIGYSPLPINLVQAGFTQINKIKAADANVDLTKRDVSTCNNPTFIAGKPQVNHLAEIAPNPPACDKVGAGPCTGTEGSYNENPTSSSSSGKKSTGTKSTTSGTTSSGSSSSSSGTTSGGDTTTAASDGTVTTVDPLTGEQTVASGTTGEVTVVPTTLAASQSDGNDGILGALALGFFLSIVVLPPALTTILRRRR